MSEKKETFKQQLSMIKNSKSTTLRIACTGEQRVNLEKCLMIVAKFPFVDKRKYATTYYLPTGSKIVIIHERMIHPLFKSKLDFDIRKWTSEQISAFFKLR